MSCLVVTRVIFLLAASHYLREIIFAGLNSLRKVKRSLSQLASFYFCRICQIAKLFTGVTSSSQVYSRLATHYIDFASILTIFLSQFLVIRQQPYLTNCLWYRSLIVGYLITFQVIC